jgi:hypothetical protein
MDVKQRTGNETLIEARPSPVNLALHDLEERLAKDS